MHTQLPDADALTFRRDGAHRVGAAVSAADMHGIVDAVAGLPLKRAGVRLHGIAALRPFLSPSGAVGEVAASALGPNCQPVRAILFDKTAEMNWSLTWHQDRTIAVAQRIEVDGFGPWTVKDGLLHVAPPFDILAGMVTLRVHLDPVPVSNAPLLIAPGSHRFGRIPEREVPDVVKRRDRRLLGGSGRYLALRNADTARLGGGVRTGAASGVASRLRGRPSAGRS
jgi:hypothetical protein